MMHERLSKICHVSYMLPLLLYIYNKIDIH